MRYAFNDNADGYYEVDVPDGELLPLWTMTLTQCPVQEPANEPILVVIPDVSPRQIRQALTRAGLRAAVEAAVAAGDQDTKDWWEFSTTFERDHPVVIAMATALGVTESDMDNLWALGLTL